MEDNTWRWSPLWANNSLGLGKKIKFTLQLIEDIAKMASAEDEECMNYMAELPDEESNQSDSSNK